MRLLIIEDEVRHAAQMKSGIAADADTTVYCKRGEEGLRQLMTGEFDLIILGVHQPDRGGWSVLEELRRHQLLTPILLLSGQGALASQVQGFELGANDYSPRPSDFHGTLGQLRNLLRRSTRDTQVLVGDLELDLETRRARRTGKELNLSPNEFLLLLFLVRRKGQPVTREDISQAVLETKHRGNSNAVEVLVRRLRAKVDDRFAHAVIHTIRGKGYMFDNLPPV